MMRLLPLSLLLMAMPAHAVQWVKTGSAGGSTSWLDKASIKRVKSGEQGGADGDFRAASLVSFDTVQTTPDGTRYRSMKAQHLYSCERHTTTLLAQSYYPQAMGKGPIAQSFKYEKFAPEPIAEGSTAAAALKMICRGRTQR